MSLRKPDLVIGQCLQPVHLLEISLLTPLVLLKHLQEVFSFRGTQDVGLLWKVRHKDEHKERDKDGDETFDDEDPSKSLQSRDSMHIANTVCQYTTNAGTQGTKAEEARVSNRHLCAGIILVDQESSPCFY